ncbi:MAG: NADH-quinone oxidoreductase subunit M [Chloroflexota bacterium]|nr:NADH-quinone oxidoreductase subunit M [Chloroflexota bacterium]
MSFPILTVIILTPLLGSIAILFIPKERDRLVTRLSIAISFVVLILAIVLVVSYDKVAGGMQFVEEYSWIPTLDVFYRLGVDGLSVPMIFLTALLTLLCIFYSSYTIKEKVKQYFMLFLMLEMGMFGVFLSLDFILFYVFWEVGLVPMFLLIAFWGGKRRLYASIKFFLYTLTGSVGMLLAILGVYLNTGTFSIMEAASLQPFVDNWPLAVLVFWGFFIGFAIKVPIFPFHTWLPDAHTEAPTSGSVILAGVLLKLGAYGLMRIALPLFPQVFGYFSYNVPIIPILAVISIVYGALICVAQWDLKRLIAYSSVSHMGYVTLGISAAAASLAQSGNSDLVTSAIIGLNGAAMQMFTHGIITGALFFLVGVIYERAHTRELRDFGGLANRVPYYYAMMMVTGLASLGLPGLVGFWSELFVFRGTFGIIPIFACIGVIGVVFTAVYILWKIIQHMFLGEFSQKKWDQATHHAPLSDLEWWEKVTLWPLVTIMIGLGLYPTPILNFLNSAAVTLLDKLQ